MKKIISILILVLVFMPAVLADGMIIDPYGYFPEKQQSAAISYKNGRENLLLTIQTDELRDEKSVWIFPVKGNPDDIIVDITPNFPQFYGQEILTKAENSVDRVLDNTRYSLLYPFLIPFREKTAMYGQDLAPSGFESAIEIGKGDVTVYEHIEKYGITTELLDTSHALELHVYLANKGLNLPFSEIPKINEYLNEDYTLVVSWFNRKELAVPLEIESAYPGRIPPYYGRRVGVSIDFPTDKIYYPLKLTSNYGSTKVPTTIYVLDYVTPEIYPDIENYVTIKYYEMEQMYYIAQELESFYPDTKDKLKYTRIDLNAPSKLLTEDLYFKETAPEEINYASKVSGIFTQKGISWLVLAILSFITGALVGYIIFRQPLKFGLIGLANLVSIIGLIVAVIFVKTKDIDKDLKKKIKSSGLTVVTADKRKILFVIFFFIGFILLSYLLGAVFKAPL